MNNRREVILECSGVSKEFAEGGNVLPIFQGLDLQVHAGERIAIIGPSGAGKSTLLHILGGLDTTTAGEVKIQGHAWQRLGEMARCQLRNRALGFVYQFHHLLGEFNAVENVCMPLLIRGQSKRQAMVAATALLTTLGLGERLQHKVGQLSGGERQRTAIARALVTRPACVLADEPTGNLDPHTASQVYGALLELNQQQGTSLLVVTHDLSLAKQMDKILRLEQGKLVQVTLA
jgi:lipoprotein-releasing system ATP-binding protein